MFIIIFADKMSGTITSSETLTSDSVGSEAEKNLTELTSTAEAITASEEFLLVEEDDSLEETEDESDEVWEI